MTKLRRAALATVVITACAPTPSSPRRAPAAPAAARVVDARADDAGAATGEGTPSATLPCGDLTAPSSRRVAPESTSAGPVQLARTQRGELFVTVTAHASFAVPSHTATTSSSHTQVASTRGFIERDGRLVEIGELVRGASLVARGGDIEGTPLALSVTRLVSADAKRAKRGMDGAGYRFVVHRPDGAGWSAATDPVEVTAADGASALIESSQAIAGVADTSEEAGPIVARLFRTQARTWQPLATLVIHVTL